MGERCLLINLTLPCMSSKLKLNIIKTEGKKLMRGLEKKFLCFCVLFAVSLLFGFYFTQENIAQNPNILSHPDDFTLQQWQTLKSEITSIEVVDIFQNKEKILATIADKKITNDIVAMINNFPAIESSVANEKISGWGQTRPQILTMITKSGIRGRVYYYSYSSMTNEAGLVRIGRHFFLVEDDTFSRHLAVLSSSFYKKHDTDIKEDAWELFRKYDWTIDFRINELKSRLPQNLKHDAGEYPYKIYWAHNNDLSKSIGLDFSRYLGCEISAEIYRLREPLPGIQRDARGIIIRYQDNIVGAYIDQGRHQSVAFSLDRKSLEEVTGKSWGEWVENYINYDNELEIRLSTLEPEEIIKEYFKAHDQGDIVAALGCFSRSNQYNRMFSNMDNTRLFNEADDIRNHGYYFKSVRIIEMEEWKHLEKINPPGTREYYVKVEYKYSKQVDRDDWIGHRYVLLRKETARGGWRIVSIGSGP